MLGRVEYQIRTSIRKPNEIIACHVVPFSELSHCNFLMIIVIISAIILSNIQSSRLKTFHFMNNI